MTNDLDPKTSVDKAKENEAKEKEEALQKLIKSLEEERKVALEDLLAKQKLTQSKDEKRKVALLDAIQANSIFFSDDSIDEGEQKKTKKSLVEEFCKKSPQFKDMVNLLEKTAKSFKLTELTELIASFAKNLDEHFSSPEKNPYNQIRVHGVNQKEIILNGKENLVDQLKAKGADLESIDKRIETCTRYLDNERPHFIPIILPDGRFLTLDINKYDRDKAQSYGPPSEPKESNQKQPTALGWSPKGILKNPAESSSAELNSNNKKNTSTTIPYYLPTPLPKKGVKFKENVKKEDGTIGTKGYWVRATTENSNETNSGNGNTKNGNGNRRG